MSKDMLKEILELPKQIKEGLELAGKTKIRGEINNILICGMGGSGIAGDILKDVYTKKPVYIVKNYFIPEFIGKNTLAFIISYSGNTEETLSAYKEALKKKCRVIVITSGGKLLKLAKKKRNKIIKVPKGFVPRTALAYLFFPILKILYNSKLIKNFDEDIEDLLNILKIEEFKNKAKDLAGCLLNRVPLIYTSNKFEAVALRWKTQFNENSKVYAYYNVFSELDHNEVVPYYRRNRDFFVILIEDDEDYYKIRKRMEITKRFIARNTDTVELEVFGETPLAKIFATIHLGDLTSYYLAIKRKVNPVSTKIIEDLRRELGYPV